MNRRHVLTGTCVVCLGILLIWLLWPRKAPKPQAKDVAVSATPPVLTAIVPAPAQQPPTKEEQKRIKDERASSIRSAIEGTNVPINFWGKVVDQDKRPLPGVAVSYQYQTEHVLLPGVAWARSEVHKGQTSTGAEGHFSIQGLRGHSLSIERFVKEGYKTPQTFSAAVSTFNYFGDTASGKYTPDKDRPVAFIMLSEQVGQDLVVFNKGDKGMRLPADGTPQRWNFWTGKKDQNGELQVTFRREPAVLANTGEPPRWEANVEIVGGGIMEAAVDEALWQAPDGGYTNAVDYPKTEQRRGTPGRSFYVKTSDGKYGRIELEIYPRDEGATVRCFINTQMNPQSGSRTVAR